MKLIIITILLDYILCKVTPLSGSADLHFDTTKYQDCDDIKDCHNCVIYGCLWIPGKCTGTRLKLTIDILLSQAPRCNKESHLC